MTLTHHTAPNQFVEGANGTRYAYRRFGKSGGVPLVCLQHFRGDLDSWDPGLTDTIAGEREVILVDNTGVALTSGRTPSTVEEMSRDIVTFCEALALEEVDAMGFSLGGFVAQELALIRPHLVRRLVLAGTGPQGGPNMHGWRKDIADAARKPDIGGPEFLYIFFKQTETSQAQGRAFLDRFLARQDDRDVLTTLQCRDAQYDAVCAWGADDHSKLQRLRSITQPTFCAQGDDDLMIPPPLTHLIAGLIPNAQIKIYPDAGHGFLWQHHAEFGADVNRFLAA